MSKDRRTKTSAEIKDEVLAKIQKFSPENRAIAERLHELIMEADPSLQPRLWYGMPGYAKTKDSAVLLFFREDKYMTFGLSEFAQFKIKDDAKNQLMPCAWFFTKLNKATEREIIQIVKSAVA